MSDFRCEKLFFKMLFFMNSLEAFLKDDYFIRVTPRHWNCYEYDNELFGEIYFGCKPQKGRGRFIAIVFSFKENETEEEHYPFWIYVEKEESLWDAIKAEFQNAEHVILREDMKDVGFPWLFDSETPLEEIKQIARTMAESISRAFRKAFAQAVE